MLRARHLLRQARDPLVRSSFLDSSARSLALAGNYEQARGFADDALAESERCRLTFALPAARCAKGLCQFGLREYRDARRLLIEAFDAAAELGDAHYMMEARTILARVALGQGAVDEAVAVADYSCDRLPAAGMWGEHLATRAIVYACAGRLNEARDLATLVRRTTRCIEAAGLATWVPVVDAVLSGSADALERARGALDLAFSTANVDSFVLAYRACPAVLSLLASDAESRPRLAGVLIRANDARLAEAHSLTRRSYRAEGPRELSPREQDVYELLAHGLSNKEIAASLFITEVTVKVHVRHILRKLGVRTRTEAAVRAATV